MKIDGVGRAAKMKTGMSTQFIKLPLMNLIMHCLKLQTDFHFYSDLTFFHGNLYKHASQGRIETITKYPISQIILHQKLLSISKRISKHRKVYEYYYYKQTL